MKTVLTYGTFDLFHAGHVQLLQRARALGDRLIIGCSTDEFNAKKGKEAIYTYSDRVKILEACRYVDKVFPEDDWAQKADDVKAHNAHTFAIGDDWAGKFDFLTQETGCIVTYLPRTPDISTTDVKDVVRALGAEKKISVIHSAERLLSLIKEL